MGRDRRAGKQNGRTFVARPPHILERVPIRLSTFGRGRAQERALESLFCRISLRKTGVHFSGKCSRARSDQVEHVWTRSSPGTRSRVVVLSHFLAENRCPLFREML